MRILLFGREGKVGSLLTRRLAEAGHEVSAVELDEVAPLEGQQAAIDFTAPHAVLGNMTLALDAGIPCIVGTSGLSEDGLSELDRLARDRGVACLVVPNFAIGAVLMMRFAEEAARVMPQAEIVELHHETKVDAPSGTAAATASRMGGAVPIHSVRLPGLVAHQEVILGAEGQTLSIRHDTTSRDAFVPGVLLAVDRLTTLAPGLTVGLDSLI